MNIQLTDCPEILQKAVGGKTTDYEKWFGEYQIISVTLFESTPYKDKSIISNNYRVYIMTANFFSIMGYSESTGEHFNLGVTESSVNIGEVREIMDHAPEWCGFHDPVPSL
jgi:hypothetical protein